MNLFNLKITYILNWIKRNKNVRCYPYSLGLKYDRELGIKQEQWEKNDVNVIAEMLIKDLEKLKIPCKLVDKTYVPSLEENLLALRIGVMWFHDDYLHYIDYHVIVKRQDGYWYSKFGELNPEQLPLGTDIELWNWRDCNNIVSENHYNSKIVYVAINV